MADRKVWKHNIQHQIMKWTSHVKSFLSHNCNIICKPNLVKYFPHEIRNTWFVIHSELQVSLFFTSFISCMLFSKIKKLKNFKLEMKIGWRVGRTAFWAKVGRKQNKKNQMCPCALFLLKNSCLLYDHGNIRSY